MKRLARNLLIAALGALGAVCLCAAACSSGGQEEEDKKPPTVEDAYGYMRPADAWITQSVILSESNYEKYKNNLFGESGDSKLLNADLIDLDGEGLYLNGQSYLVYLIYGDGLDSNGCAFDTYFQLNYADGGAFSTGAECPINFGEAIYDSDKLKLSLDMNESAEKRLKVSPVSATESKLQTTVVIPFKPASDSGVLFADMRVDAPYLSANNNSFADGVHTARIGGFTHGFSAVVDDVKIRFAGADDCPGGEINESALKYSADFQSGETVYAVIDFNVGALSDNAGGATLTANIVVPEAEIAKVTVHEATTGNVNERTENGCTRVDAGFSVPDLASNKKPARVVLRVNTEYDGFSDIGVYFSCEGADVGCNPYYEQRLKWGDPVFRYDYAELKNGWRYITGVWDKSATSVTLPDTYDGKEVKVVRSGAFDGMTIRKLTLGANTENVIGSLSSCYAIEEIVVPDSNGKFFVQTGILYDKQDMDSFFIPEKLSGTVSLRSGIKTVKASYFAGKAITEIRLPESVTTIEKEAFKNCFELGKISLGGGVTKIGRAAFWGTAYYSDKKYWTNDVLYIEDCLISAGQSYQFDGNNRSYTIKDGTRVIADSAFINCTKLTGFTIPDSVKAIGENAFTATGYYLNDSNWKDGALYIGKNLIAMKSITSTIYRIKTGTVLIADKAFESSTAVKLNVENLIIPDSVKYIGREAIGIRLTSVLIGSGVTELRYHCFNDTVESFYYNGTPEKWKELNRDEDYRVSSGIIYYYSKNKPTSTNYWYWHYVNNLPVEWE